MKVWKNSKGNRIRVSDKSLVYHFCIGWLLLLFVAVFLLLNLRQLLVTDWKDFNLLHAGNPIGYTDLTSAYWQQHIICAGRIKQQKGLAYYVKGGVLAPVSGDYVFSELVNPVFTKDGDNLKVSVSVKYLDNKSKMTQISQYELVLHKDDNWKIVE